MTTSSADSTDAGKSPWPGWLLLTVIVVVAAFTGWAMRQVWVKPKQDQLKSVKRLMDVGLDVHNSLVERYAAGIIDQDAMADGIERKTLPIWALAKAEGLKADRVTGGPLDMIIDYLRLRRDGSERIVAAIRAKDAALLERSKATRQTAKEALKRLKPTERRAAIRR